MIRSPVRRFVLASSALAASLVLAAAAHAHSPQPLASGIDRSTADPSVRIQDDAFRAVEGKWLAETAIPADRKEVGTFEAIEERTQPQLRALIEGLPGSASADAAGAADARKIADLYAVFLDEPRIEALGTKPVAHDLATIDAARSRPDLAALIATLDRLGVDTPFVASVHLDAKDATKYVVDLGQSGIGLPDRDYFLSQGDARFATIRAQYETYVARLLTLIGERDAAAKARAVVALEHRIAEAQWSRVENRDPVKTYNVVALPDLPKLAPHIDWPRYLAEAGIAGKTDSVVISQPTYVKRLDAIVASVPVATWNAYFKAHFLTAYAPYLGRAFVDTRFAFVGTALRGTPENMPRWKRGVTLVESSLGEGLGRLYVAKYFPPDSKARMDALVGNLLAAYRASIDGLDWMGPATKREAQAKLATFMPKIGYPVRWRDYGALAIDRADLVGDVERAKAFEYDRNLAKLGRPVDRDEWGMTPQMINAYYNREMNEIVFPAAVLQRPFFDPTVDDAANYGRSAR